MSVNEKHPRPLRPRLSPTEGLTSDTTSESPQSVPDALSHSRARSFQTSRSNIRSACLACRQRRSKCSGGIVCNRCRSRGTHCVYEEAQDRRTRAVRDKGKEELELHKRVIDGVFRAIRIGGDDTVLNLIRENASLHTIAAAIGEDTVVESDQEYQCFEYSESQSADTSPSVPRELPLSTPVFGNHLNQDRPQMPSDITQLRENGTGLTSELNLVSVQSTFPDNENESLDGRILVPEHESLAFRYMLKPEHELGSDAVDTLSRFYLHFRDASQQVIARGVPAKTILGPSAISCGALFQTGPTSEPLNVSSWAAAVVSSFPDLDIYFRLAWMSLLVRFMRWCIDTTRENFEALPDIMKPTSLQISMQHAPHIDLVPLPHLRNHLIKKFSDFTATLQVAGATVNWRAPFEEAVYQHPITGHMTITAAFEKHAADPDHYVFGRHILQSFAEVENVINIADHDHLVSILSSPPFT